VPPQLSIETNQPTTSDGGGCHHHHHAQDSYPWSPRVARIAQDFLREPLSGTSRSSAMPQARTCLDRGPDHHRRPLTSTPGSPKSSGGDIRERRRMRGGEGNGRRSVQARVRGGFINATMHSTSISTLCTESIGGIHTSSTTSTMFSLDSQLHPNKRRVNVGRMSRFKVKNSYASGVPPF
jgi:hypothetical protein